MSLVTFIRSILQPPYRRALLVLFGYLQLVLLAARPAAPLDSVARAVYERGSLRVAIDAGYRPFADLVDGRPSGFDVELVTLLAAELGLQVEFVLSGYDALYDQLSSGTVDMIASALPYAPEQGYRARFSQPYFDAGLLLLVPATSPITQLEQLSGRVLGVVLGAPADSWARRHQPAALVRRFDDEPALVAALTGGTVDAVALDRVAALPLLAGADLRLVSALSYEPYVLALPVSAFALERDMNTALTRLRERGALERLEQRWMVQTVR